MEEFNYKKEEIEILNNISELKILLKNEEIKLEKVRQIIMGLKKRGLKREFSNIQNECEKFPRRNSICISSQNTNHDAN